MKIIPLGETDSLLGHYLAQIRDINVNQPVDPALYITF